MTFAAETRNRGHSFAKAHHLCCNVTGGFFLILGLCFIIAGSVLVSQNQAAFYQEINGGSWKPNWDNYYDDFWDEGYHNHKVVLFGVGVGLLSFGILFFIFGGICVSCACCSRDAAYADRYPSPESSRQVVQPAPPPQPSYSRQQPYQPPPPAAPYPTEPPPYSTVVGPQMPTAPPTGDVEKSGY